MTMTQNTTAAFDRTAREDNMHSTRHRIHPTRDWSVALLVTVALFLIGFAASGYFFARVDRKATATYAATLDAVTYDRALVTRVLANYRARQVRYESLGGRPVFGPARINRADTAGVVSEATGTSVAADRPL